MPDLSIDQINSISRYYQLMMCMLRPSWHGQNSLPAVQYFHSCSKQVVHEVTMANTIDLINCGHSLFNLFCIMLFVESQYELERYVKGVLYGKWALATTLMKTIIRVRHPFSQYDSFCV